MSSRRTALFSLLLFAVSPSPLFAQAGAFGNSVLISGDEIIVAEPTTSFRPGTVYIYRDSGGSWEEAARLRAPDARRADGFGSLLALAGSTLFVGQRGQPALHVFAKEGTEWRYSGALDTGVSGASPECGDWGQCGTDFGLSLAGGGDWLMLGEPGVAPRNDGRGSGREAGTPEPPRAGVVHVFERSAAGGWTRQAELAPADGAPGDRFGAMIALEAGRALIGAPDWSVAGTGGDEPVPVSNAAGRVYEYRLDGRTWRESGVLPSASERNANFGAAIAVRAGVAVVGAPGSGVGHGAALVYSLAEGGGWTQRTRLAAFSGSEGDRFGGSVAIAGEEIWIGAPTPRGIDMGAVYVFDGAADALPDGTRRIQLDETVHRDAFGDRIAASESVVAVSATGMHHRAGAVQVYERDAAGVWMDAGRLLSEPDALPAIVGEEHRCPVDGSVGLFDCNDVELLAYLPVSMLSAAGSSRGVWMNDNWGWTDSETGREYALVGRNDGTAFVDITDPVNPRLMGDLPKTPDTPPSQLWRDIKTYDGHAFIVADGAGRHGMQVFDLSRLRDVSDPPVVFEPDALYRGEGANVVESTHNVVINRESGFAYLTSRGCSGLHIVDIREPLNPRFAGCSDPGDSHDAQCVVYEGPDEAYRGREICLRMSGSRFQISDVTDKDDPVELATASHPNPAYMHQGWLTDDHRYFFMDDESDVIRGLVETTRTLVWDVSELESPVLSLSHVGSLPAAAHNLYIKDNLMYQANYRYGLQIVDVSDPMNPIEVGHFDTSPYHDGPGWGGAWSNYPFFESGTLIVTSMQEGLFILKRRIPLP